MNSKWIFSIALTFVFIAQDLAAQSIDKAGRYLCQTRTVVDSKNGKLANVSKLTKSTNSKITSLTTRISALRGTSSSVKKQRAKLILQRADLRKFVKDLKACAKGTFVPAATPTPAATATLAGPTATPTLTPTPGVARPHVSAGEDHTCVTSSTGSVRCIGGNSFGQIGIGASPSTVTTPAVPTGLTGISFSSIDAGGGHTCAAGATSGYFCWGFNTTRQLGDGTTVPKSTPISVTGLSGQFVQAVTADGHSCAVQAQGSVVCWGQNSSGESGTGTTSTTVAPTSVVGLATTVTRIAASSRHTCAVLGNGSVQCWGLNSQGPLGMGGVDFTQRSQATTPNNLRANVSIIDVATGHDHTCLLYRDGIVQCVGQNDVGQMGIGSSSNREMTFVSAQVSGVSAIAAGDDFTCAIVSNGSGVSCWGKGTSGQLGNGASSNSSAPVSVTGLTGTITGITAGEKYACALIDNNTVKCWGDNANSQYGVNGSSSAVAVEIPGLQLNN
jgi:alpha-tubulin suppressor-like RCC1 family protein